MAKTIFDLGYYKHSREGMEYIFEYIWEKRDFDSCKATWLECYNNHGSSCKRKAILDQFMWTRKR